MDPRNGVIEGWASARVAGKKCNEREHRNGTRKRRRAQPLSPSSLVFEVAPDGPGHLRRALVHPERCSRLAAKGLPKWRHTCMVAPNGEGRRAVGVVPHRPLVRGQGVLNFLGPGTPVAASMGYTEN